MTRGGGARRRNEGERGVALVEFALILPALVLLVFGVLDFGKAINYWLDANHLANEGARWVVVNKDLGPAGPSPTLEQYLRAQADTDELRTGGTDSVAAPGLEVCLTYPDGNQNTGSQVKVTATVEYNWLPVLGLDVASSTITGSATMRIEQAVSLANYPADATC